MLEWLQQYKEEIGGLIIAVGGVFAVLWGKIQSMRTERAKTGADVAIAESQKEVYQQMNERMTAMDSQITRLQQEVDSLRVQLRTRDDKIHSLDLYVQDLQYTLHKHGIDVPQMRM